MIIRGTSQERRTTKISIRLAEDNVCSRRRRFYVNLVRAAGGLLVIIPFDIKEMLDLSYPSEQRAKHGKIIQPTRCEIAA